MKSLWGPSSRYLRVRRTAEVSPRFARGLVIALAVLAALIFIAGDVGLWRLWVAQRDIAELRQRIGDLEERNTLLRAEIDRLQRNDPFAIEKVAREKYGFLREGDLVYRIVTPEANAENIPGVRSALDRSVPNP